MDHRLVTTATQPAKLHVALSSPVVAFQVDIPSSIDANTYFTLLASKIAGDFEILTASVQAVKQATITARHTGVFTPGDEMSERIAKIERSLEHLQASMGALDAKLDRLNETSYSKLEKLIAASDAKLDRLIAVSAEDKAVNAVLKDKFVEYDKKLDKKPSKDEVEKLISQGTTKQVLWTIGTFLVIAGILYKLLA